MGKPPICKRQPPLFKATNAAFSRWQSSFHGGKYFGRWQSAVSKVTNCSFQGDKLLLSRWQFAGGNPPCPKWQSALFKVTICSFHRGKNSINFIFYFYKGPNPLRWQTPSFQGDALLFQGVKVFAFLRDIISKHHDIITSKCWGLCSRAEILQDKVEAHAVLSVWTTRILRFSLALIKKKVFIKCKNLSVETILSVNTTSKWEANRKWAGNRDLRQHSVVSALIMYTP